MTNYDDNSHHPEDKAQTLSSETQVTQLLEHLVVSCDVNPFVTARRILNLFAGYADESAACFNHLAAANNTNCIVVAIDKNPPVEPTERLVTSHPNTFEYVKSDVFIYLSSQANQSADLITAIGAEYVLNGEKLVNFIREASRILNPGGIVFMPLLGTHHKEQKEMEGAGFTMLLTGFFQKNKP